MTDHDALCPLAGYGNDATLCPYCPVVAEVRADERERIAQREEWAVLYDGDPKMDGGYERRELGRWFSEEKARAAMASVQVRDRSGSKPNLRMEMRYVTGWEAR